ncbi:DUF5694 domain-containing protein [Mucilaginibacter sp. CSA2-8R]|uniref:DUF5694 domain-containing protein n=1 Tax=Mucilaginibacter sp. CSA2-8R TaxID=3141542 RepID=UPI00315CC276
MKHLYTILFLLTGLLSATVSQTRPDKINVILMGSTHFGQEGFYKQGPSMDLFSPGRQKEIADINKQLAQYRPDMILIEREPSEQHTVDSLYNLYTSGKLQFAQLSYGRAEQYQFGYTLAKQLNLPQVYGVDFYSSLPTRLMRDGKNLDKFIEDLNKFSNLGRSFDQQLKDGQLSLKQYLLKLNAPETLQATYYNIYINPARVTDGSFGKADKTVDTARIDKSHIGAEYISLFYNRELKIYSNLLSLQQAHQSKRILLIMGQRHAAVLSKILEDNPDFNLVPLSSYLK